MKNLALITVVIISSLFLCVANATGGIYFMKDVAIRYFTDQDWNLFNTNLKKALDSYPDGSKLVWQNTRNGHWGSFAPSKTTKVNGHVCRNLAIFNSAEGRTGNSQYQFCKYNNAWKIPK